MSIELTHEDLIGVDNICIDGIGHIKIPKLQEIWNLKYKIYELMINYLNVGLDRYLSIKNIETTETFYNLIIKDKEFLNIYFNIFTFFIIENVDFDFNNNSFVIFEQNDNTRNIVGKIDNSNFNDIREILLNVNYIKQQSSDEEKPIYKNELAKKMYEQMQKAKRKQEEKNQLTFGKLVSKYCADNKNGINMLNVHQLTIYQFYDQWFEHNYIKQCDLQDVIYANTVNFNDVSKYDSQLWLKKI